MKSSELVGAMAHEPSNDGPGVLFVLDIEVEERGRDAATTRGSWMRGSDQHVYVGGQDWYYLRDGYKIMKLRMDWQHMNYRLYTA